MGKKKQIKDLSALKSVKFKKDKEDVYTLPYQKQAPPKEETLDESAEEELFMSAMRGVKQMEGGSGRQVPPGTDPIAQQQNFDPEERAKQDLQRFLRGEVDFELEYTDEYMYGYVRGLDIKTFQQLKSGSLSVAAHLDLHGMTADQAQDSLLFFIRESYMMGHRCVLVVTGRGHNSPGGQAILRRETELWLTRDPIKRVVLAFCTAQTKDGGAGALYVLLRKQKKAQGKISWDKMHNWSE